MKSLKETMSALVEGKVSYDQVAKQWCGADGKIDSGRIDEASFNFSIGGELPDWYPMGVSGQLIDACELYMLEPSAKTAMNASRAAGITVAQAMATLANNDAMQPIQLAIALVSVAEQQRETKDETQPDAPMQPRVILRKGYPVYRDNNGRKSVTWVGDTLHIVAQEPTVQGGQIVMSDTDRIPGYVGKMRGLKLRIESIEENPDILPRFVSDDDACKVIDLADGEFIDISAKLGLLNK